MKHTGKLTDRESQFVFSKGQFGSTGDYETAVISLWKLAL